MSAASCSEPNGVGLPGVRPAEQRRLGQEDLVDRGAARDVILLADLAQRRLAGHERDHAALVRLRARRAAARLAVTMCSPSIITIFDCSGANGALLDGSVKLLVVAGAVRDARDRSASPADGAERRSAAGPARPAARASMLRNIGNSNAAEPPQARRNDRRAIL